MVDFLPDEDLKPNLILIIEYLVMLHVSGSRMLTISLFNTNQKKLSTFQSKYSNDAEKVEEGF